MKLPNNFKCADVICDFCGYLAQVKTVRVRNVESVPNAVLGAAWGPQKDRMASAIYFPLFLVLIGVSKTAYSIFYLSADLQVPSMFQPRSPLSPTAGAQDGKASTTTSVRCVIALFASVEKGDKPPASAFESNFTTMSSKWRASRVKAKRYNGASG